MAPNNGEEMQLNGIVSRGTQQSDLEALHLEEAEDLRRQISGRNGNHYEHLNFLSDLPDEEIPETMEEFLNTNRFPRDAPSDETPLTARMIKAARVIKYRRDAETDRYLESKAGLESSDMRMLKNEGVRQEQPFQLFLTIAQNSIAAIIQGWDQTGTNGANLLWPEELGLSVRDCYTKRGPGLPPPNPQVEATCSHNTLMVGLVNSGPYIAICLLACWLSDPLNHWLGRKMTIFLGALFGICAPVGSAFSQTWPQLFACRVLLGLGMGLKEVTVPILSAEIAPRQIRGALIMSWQLCTAIGIMLGCAANLVCAKLSSDRDVVWRLQVGSAFIPALCLSVLVWFSSESPRWLIRRQRIADAHSCLLELRGRGRKLLADRDIYYLDQAINHQKSERFTGRGAFARVGQLFTRLGVWRANLAASIVMISQQLCGINILAFYSATIFSTMVTGTDDGEGSSGYNMQLALYFTLGIGILNVLFAIPAFFLVDRWGRRPLLLLTIPGMFLCQLIAGCCYLISTEDEDYKLIPVTIFVYLFVVFYSSGVGPMAFTYAAEVFPITHREIGMSWAVAMNNLFAAVLSLCFPLMWQTYKPTGSGVFFFFAGSNIFSLVLTFLFVPETRAKELEEMKDMFEKKTYKVLIRQHLCQHEIPWIRDRIARRSPGSYPEFE